MTSVSVITCDKEESSLLIVKTLDHKGEYILQLWAYVNTWYLFAPLQRVQLRFSEELY